MVLALALARYQTLVTYLIFRRRLLLFSRFPYFFSSRNASLSNAVIIPRMPSIVFYLCFLLFLLFLPSPCPLFLFQLPNCAGPPLLLRHS